VPGTNRGAIPLAVLVTASLAAGIVAAVDRLNEQEEGPRAQPSPAVPASPSPAIPASPSPAQPTDQPTEPTTPEPATPEPTDEPTTEPTEEPETPGPDATPLARTGGPTLPFYGGGLILMAAAGFLWRFSRVR
jgi:hypothetical protein